MLCNHRPIARSCSLHGLIPTRTKLHPPLLSSPRLHGQLPLGLLVPAAKSKTAAPCWLCSLSLNNLYPVAIVRVVDAVFLVLATCDRHKDPDQERQEHCTSSRPRKREELIALMSIQSNIIAILINQARGLDHESREDG